jgi:hypothetical protein
MTRIPGCLSVQFGSPSVGSSTAVSAQACCKRATSKMSCILSHSGPQHHTVCFRLLFYNTQAELEAAGIRPVAVPAATPSSSSSSSSSSSTRPSGAAGPRGPPPSGLRLSRPRRAFGAPVSLSDATSADLWASNTMEVGQDGGGGGGVGGCLGVMQWGLILMQLSRTWCVCCLVWSQLPGINQCQRRSP